MNPNLNNVTSEYVLKAIDFYDKVGDLKFFDITGFGNSKTYFLLYNKILYPSKAIIGYAYNLQFPDLEKATPKNISGGVDPGNAAYCLKELDFEIFDKDDEQSRKEAEGEKELRYLESLQDENDKILGDIANEWAYDPANPPRGDLLGGYDPDEEE